MQKVCCHSIEINKTVSSVLPRGANLVRSAAKRFLSTSLKSVTKATSNLPCGTPSHLDKIDVPLVDALHLEEIVSLGSGFVGSGRFGVCCKMVYAGKYTVCVKKLSSDTPDRQLLTEARILRVLGTHKYIPYCFGICTSEHSIVMSFHAVSGIAINVHRALYKTPTEMTFDPLDWVNCLKDIVEALDFIHNKGYLHNDIKLDNIVLGDGVNGRICAYLIDFNKACLISCGKSYNLSETDIKFYKQNHPQIAPDLRDGLVRQSTASDVYSIGRVIKTVCKHKLKKIISVSDIAAQCLHYNGVKRPNLQKVSHFE